jgi:pyruvate dehydrogenase E1 component alpha subunit
MHVSAPAEGAVGANGIVGGGIPHAVGLAFAAKRLGRDTVAVAFFGDGAANQGVLFESLNLAALWEAPVVFVCENNGYTEFTPTSAVTAGESIAGRAAAFGLPSHTVDGDDVAEVHEVARGAAARARAGGGPSFVESRTHRWRGHHEGEESYARPYREPVASRDPIDRLVQSLSAAGVDATALRATIEPEEEAFVTGALAAAQAEPEPPVERAREDVYA